MLSIKALFVLGCLTITEGIRIVSTSTNNINNEMDKCLMCKTVVSEIDYQLASNMTETMIINEITKVCKSNQYCEFMLPMIVNKIIDCVIMKSDTICTDLEIC